MTFGELAAFLIERDIDIDPTRIEIETSTGIVGFEPSQITIINASNPRMIITLK